MANVYVRSSSSNTSPYNSWATAATTLATAAGFASAGDTVWVSQAHAETAGSAKTISFTNATAASPIFCVCGNDANAPPTALATTATVTTTGNFAISINAAASGSVYVYGITFSSGTGANAVNMTGLSGTTTNGAIVFDTCGFITAGTTGGAIIVNSAAYAEYRSCTFKVASTASYLRNSGGATRLIGCSWAAGGTAPTTCFGNSAATVPIAGIFEVTGFDFSNLPSTQVLAYAGLASATSMTLRDSKRPVSWTGTLFDVTPTNYAFTPWGSFSVDNAGTNYNLASNTKGGSMASETTIVRTSGASDGTTQLSWKMTSTANVNWPGATVMHTQEFEIWNTSTSSVTVTVEMVSDGASALNNNQAWLEIDYLSASGSPISTRASSAPTNFLTTPTAITTSAAAWPNATGTGPNGSSTWNKQKMQITITPGMAGPILARVFLAKPSWTVYIDPLMTVA